MSRVWDAIVGSGGRADRTPPRPHRVRRKGIVPGSGRRGRYRYRQATGAGARSNRPHPGHSGLGELVGTSAFHCPDCDGPSVAGCDIGVLGHDTDAASLALYLLTWTDRTILLTNGLEPALEPAALTTLGRHHVAIETAPVRRVVGSNGSLHEVQLAGHRSIPVGALFFHWGSEPSSDLARATGCTIGSMGHVDVDRSSMETSIAGIYAAGDIVGRPHLAISAAAEGVRAALSIHRSLLPDEFHL